jgi:lipopolysaccharide/colanic/teichoic acid biosynthesis glycosyltransferase
MGGSDPRRIQKIKKMDSIKILLAIIGLAILLPLLLFIAIAISAKGAAGILLAIGCAALVCNKK